MDRIEQALVGFGTYNSINLDNYVTQEGKKSFTGECLFIDRYIGKDIFKKKIVSWLNLFASEDKEIYLNLLQRYRYYTEQSVTDAIYDIANEIKDECNLDDFNDIYFITFASNENIFCGGDNLRSCINVALQINSSNLLLDSFKEINLLSSKAKVIIILDDVLGTGETFFGRAVKIISELKLDSQSDVKIYAAYICANEKKIIKKITQLKKATGIEVGYKVHEFLEKELSENKIPQKKDRDHIWNVTGKYDSLLYEKKTENDFEADCIRGYHDSQLLLTFYYNTPNNTFAVFWRPSTISEPLFLRNNLIYKRPTIDVLKKKKENARAVHYKAQSTKLKTYHEN